MFKASLDRRPRRERSYSYKGSSQEYVKVRTVCLWMNYLNSVLCPSTLMYIGLGLITVIVLVVAGLRFLLTSHYYDIIGSRIHKQCCP